MEKIYYSIAEVSEILGEEKSTLRFWEDEFELKIKRRNNIRQYVQKDIDELKDIQFALRTEKLTIEGYKKHRKLGKNTNKKRNINEILTDLRQELVDLQKRMNYQPTFVESVVIE